MNQDHTQEMYILSLFGGITWFEIIVVLHTYSECLCVSWIHVRPQIHVKSWKKTQNKAFIDYVNPCPK